LFDIAVVRTNSIVDDARVSKILGSLTKRYSILVIGWNREGYNFPDIDNLKKQIIAKSKGTFDIVVKILCLRAPFGKKSLISYIPMICYFPIFWTWVLINLIRHRPKIVHACDLDTFLPCYLYRLIFRKKIVFDIHDRYAMTFIPAKFKILYLFVNLMEEIFSKRADVLMTLSERTLESFRSRPNRCYVILNCPEDHKSNEEKREDDILTLVYTGAIVEGRGLENIARAVKNLSNVEFYMYGPVVDKQLLDHILETKNIKYGGYLHYEEYYNAILNADAIIAIYGSEGPLQQKSYNITVHNKTLEAMMGGIPIITNVSSEIIQEFNFGIVVEYGDIAKIQASILSLRDKPEFRKLLGRNGRRAYLEKYNWAIVEKELFRAYSELIN
jgi:glycosyltransferase involved in cell wall biosynthesis